MSVNQKNNRAIFILVRTGSTRLPKKCLMAICGITTIQHVIRRAKRSKQADTIVLCTTELPEDDILCHLAQQEGIFFYRGSTKDKLQRLRNAARKFHVDFFVTSDGDDLFCEPELMDLAFTQYKKTKADFIEGKGLACGAFTYGIKVKALEKVCEIKGTDDTEMMWVYFKDTGLFQCEELQNVDRIFQRPEIRMTLDYPEDFAFFSHIISQLSLIKENFNLRDVLSYLDQHPEVVQINQYRQKEFEMNQKKRTKLVLKNNRENLHGEPTKQI